MKTDKKVKEILSLVEDYGWYMAEYNRHPSYENAAEIKKIYDKIYKKLDKLIKK